MKFSSEFRASQIGQAADELSVDVIGMIFLFHESGCDSSRCITVGVSN